MGRKAKRLRILKRIERLTAKADQPISAVSNSEMQEKVKKEVPPPIVEEPKIDVVEEPESVVEEVKAVEQEPIVLENFKPKPKPKPKTTRTRKPRSTTTRARKKKSVE